MKRYVVPTGRLCAGLALTIGLSIPVSFAAAFTQIGQNFIGSQSGLDSDASPPDTDGAVGPKYFVEFLNGVFSVYDKTSGTRVQTKSDLSFWAAAGVSISSTLDITDPRVVFDVYSGRWFASMIDFNPNSNRVSANRFLLAVSASSDPTGPWKGVALRADPVTLDFADFPTLGVDATGVYLSGDILDRTSTEVGPTLVIFPKNALLALTPDFSTRTSLGVMNFISRGSVVQPAV